MIKEFIAISCLIGLFHIMGYFTIAGIVLPCTRQKPNIQGVEFVNPVWWYKNYRVNYFGAAMAALGCTLLCPIAAIAYWFYKLCTVGRR